MRYIKKITVPRIEGFYNDEIIQSTTDFGIYNVVTEKLLYQSPTRMSLRSSLADELICTEKISLEPNISEWFFLNKQTNFKKVFYQQTYNENLFYHSYHIDFDCFLVKDSLTNSLKFIDTKDTIRWELIDTDVHYIHEYKNKIVIISYKKKHIIKCVDLLTGKLEWEVDVSEIGRHIDSGRDNIGIVHSYKVRLYKHIAIIPLLFWGNIGIDINTGAILWKLNDRETYHSYQFGHLMYGISEFLYEFDAITGQVLRTKDLREILDMKDSRICDAMIAIQGISISERYIIFGNKGLVFVVDRLTFTLIETLEIDARDGTYSGGPLYIDGMLYIVDCNNFLHVIKDNNYT
jgi:hypothetical protein